jgi:uncharacterized protein (DUF433 family)
MRATAQTGISYLDRPDGSKKPVIAGSRIRVSQIAIEHERLGMTAEDILDAHPHLKLFQIYDALAYYFRHQSDVDREIADDESTVRRYAQKYGIARAS